MPRNFGLSSNALIGTLEVCRDLSGGVRIQIGQVTTVLSPDDARKFADAVMRAADVAFVPYKPLVTPP